MSNDMVVEEIDEMEIGEAARQWLHLINWRLDCHDEDVKPGTDERARVEQSGMLQGQQKRLSEYEDWLYPVVSIKGTEGSLSLCLISQQEQRRCKDLLEIIGDGYGPDPDYVTDPQNCKEARQNVGTPLGEYFTSGKAKENFFDAHVEGYSHHYLQALRYQGESTVWVESLDGEKPVAWAVCEMSDSSIQRPTQIDIVYERPNWMPNKLFVALYLLDNHENTDTQ